MADNFRRIACVLRRTARVRGDEVGVFVGVPFGGHAREAEVIEERAKSG